MTHSFTATDRADLDRYKHDLTAYRGRQLGASVPAICTGQILQDVYDRQLYRLDECEDFDAWLRKAMDIGPVQGDNYLDISGFPIELAQKLHIAMPSLLRIVYKPQELWEALAQVEEEGLHDRFQEAARTGTAVLKQTNDVALAAAVTLAVARGERKPAPRPKKTPSQLGQEAERGIGRVIKLVVHLAFCKAEGARVETAWMGRLRDRLAELIEEVARLLGQTPAELLEALGFLARREVVRDNSAKRAAETGESDSENEEMAAESALQDDESVEDEIVTEDTEEVVPPRAPAPAPRPAAASPPRAAAPAPRPAAASAPGPAAPQPQAAPPPANDINEQVTDAIKASMTEEEQKELEGHLYLMLQNRQLAAAYAYLPQLYERCQRQGPGVGRALFDEWLGRMTDMDYEKRWSFVMAFFLTARLPGFRDHLALLKYHRLPKLQKWNVRRWNEKIPEVTPVTMAEMEAQYGHLYANGETR